MLLWRVETKKGVWEKYMRLLTDTDSTKRDLTIQGMMFFNDPELAKELARQNEDNPVVILFVPFASVKATFWVSEMLADHLFWINGPAHLVDVMFLDSDSDLDRMAKWHVDYYSASMRIAYWSIDLPPVEEVMTQL